MEGLRCTPPPPQLIKKIDAKTSTTSSLQTHAKETESRGVFKYGIHILAILSRPGLTALGARSPFAATLRPPSRPPSRPPYQRFFGKSRGLLHCHILFVLSNTVHRVSREQLLIQFIEYLKYLLDHISPPSSPPTIRTQPPLPLSPPSVKIRVARFPADGSAPTLEYVTTTTETVLVAPDLFPSHIPNVSTFWKIPPKMIYRRDWDITQLKDTYYNGLYMTLYSFADNLPENRYVPKMFRHSMRRMNRDVFVAKLVRGQCGEHGWAPYEDISLNFLELDCARR